MKETTQVASQRKKANSTAKYVNRNLFHDAVQIFDLFPHFLSAVLASKFVLFQLISFSSSYNGSMVLLSTVHEQHTLRKSC